MNLQNGQDDIDNNFIEKDKYYVIERTIEKKLKYCSTIYQMV